MIKRDFLYYDTYAMASLLRFAADETNTRYTVGFRADVQVGEPLIAWTTMVIIGDSAQMWVRGRLLNLGSNASMLELQQAIAELNKDARHKVAFFAGITPDSRDAMQSLGRDADPTEVLYSPSIARFVVPAGGIGTGGLGQTGGKVYSNWQNRSAWSDDEFSPYADCLYVCLADHAIYLYADGELMQVSGATNITVDPELDDTSENPVQNRVVTQELDKRLRGAYLEPADFRELRASDCEPGVLYFELGEVLDSDTTWHLGDELPMILD